MSLEFIVQIFHLVKLLLEDCVDQEFLFRRFFGTYIIWLLLCIWAIFTRLTKKVKTSKLTWYWCSGISCCYHDIINLFWTCDECDWFLHHVISILHFSGHPFFLYQLCCYFLTHNYYHLVLVEFRNLSRWLQLCSDSSLSFS